MKITPTAVKVLGILYGYREPVPAARLNEQYYGTRSAGSASRVLLALERRGFVERVPIATRPRSDHGAENPRMSYQLRHYRITQRGRDFYNQTQGD